MSEQLLIKNAHIIGAGEPFNGDILVADGKISAIGSFDAPSDCETIDATGLVAAPGLIDLHVHLRDPGLTHKEDIISGCKAAAAGGVTGVVAMPNTKPSVDNEETLAYILEKAKNASAKVYPVAAVTKGLKGEELVDFDTLSAAGACAFSDDGEPVKTAPLLLEALKASQRCGKPFLAHCEEKSLALGGLMNEGEVSQKLGVKGIPNAAEDIGTAREIAAAMSTGTRVHICHVSTAESVNIIRAAKAVGADVTAETCPHYFALTEDKLLSRDADYRMNPPLRTEKDRLAIIEGIVDGTIDAIATDHAPHAESEKADFLSAPNGSVGIETSLSAGITYLVKTGIITLRKLIDMMSTVPAKILGVEGGSLAVGSAADIVVFSESESWTVDPDKLHGKSKNTPFKGMKLCGRVKYTILNGKTVYKDEVL
ncbi:MAG: dihydroorotase [Clostridia bacterium]|nr:dihydroorotase [Clostridia bacterium]